MEDTLGQLFDSNLYLKPHPQIIQYLGGVMTDKQL